MSNEQKVYPTHRLVFSSQTVDQQGAVNSSAPTEVAVVWARTNGKQGGTLDWAISAKALGEGEYFLRENRQPGEAFDASAPTKTYLMSYSEKQTEQPGTSKLGRPVNVASVDEKGKVDWLIKPERLDNGVFFVLDNNRAQSQDEHKLANAFAQIEAKKKDRGSSLER